MKLFTEQQVELAAKTNLVHYLNETEGFTFIRKHKYARCKQHDSLIVKGNLFYWNSRGETGNAIQFIQYFMNMGFKASVIHLLDFNNIHHEVDEEPIFTVNNKSGGSVIISKDNLKNAYAYLIKKRGISKDVIDELVDKGLLLMSRVDNRPPNITFKIMSPTGEVAGYEVHGTYDKKRFKNCIPDEQGRLYGFNIQIGRRPNKAYIFESAIDLVSFYEMWRKRNPQTMKDVILISLSGLKEGVIEEMQRDFNIKELIMCVDNDTAGMNFQRLLLKKGFEFKSIEVPGGLKDWNELLIQKGV